MRPHQEEASTFGMSRTVAARAAEVDRTVVAEAARRATGVAVAVSTYTMDSLAVGEAAVGGTGEVKAHSY